MNVNTRWSTLLAIPILSISATSALANEPSNQEVLGQIENYNTLDPLEQVNSVTQFRDVQPTDWAYEALRGLVERYGCIAGYPNGTYRGNRAMTRYEFAAGLYSCLLQIERLIAASTGDTDGVAPDDLATLERLISEFEAELATLGTRVDNLEARLGEVEENLFSTTTQLSGEVVLGLADVFGGENIQANDPNVTDDLEDLNTVLGYRARLEFNTSFTGEDLLYTRLATGNFPDYTETGLNDLSLAFAQPDGNDVAVEVLYYAFPLTDSTEVFVAATGGAADDFADTLNILDGDGALGALSTFGTRNSIYYPVEGAGAAIIQQFGDKFEFSAGYLTPEASDPNVGLVEGSFEGTYGALGQLVFRPTENLNLGFTYVRLEKQSGTGVGSSLANFDFADQGVTTSSESYGLELSWQLSDRFVLGGWAGYTTTDVVNSFVFNNTTVAPGDFDTWTWAVTLGLPDFGKEGNLGGVVFGMPPKVTDSDFPGFEDQDTTYHVEAFYQYQLTEGIFVTPGVIWITAPNQNDDNDDVFIGTLRTTFVF
jgi:hypothetical protein